MLKKNVAGIEKMMADWLQYRWRMYLHVKDACGKEQANKDFLYYQGACDLIQNIGGTWRREYTGDDSHEQLHDPKKYYHWVRLPSDKECENINFNVWAE